MDCDFFFFLNIYEDFVKSASGFYTVCVGPLHCVRSVMPCVEIYCCLDIQMKKNC